MFQRLLRPKFKWILFFLISNVFNLVNAQDLSRAVYNESITRQDNKDLAHFLREIEGLHHVNFIYQKGLLDGKQIDAAKISQTDALESILNKVLLPCKLRYKKLKGKASYTILPSKNKKYSSNDSQNIETDLSELTNAADIEISQKKNSTNLDTEKKATAKVALTVSGKVNDENGYALPGVSVSLKNTIIGTNTDAEGKYLLNISGGNEKGILVFSFIGYTTKEILLDGRLIINVDMAPDVKSLTEVVVVGYGKQKKTDIISSIATVKAENLILTSAPNFDASLQGVAAGVSVQSSSGAPGSPVTIKIRGTSSVTLGTDPLWIIDGMPVISGSVGNSNLNPMSLINMHDIESVQVLKDAAATSIYGSRGSNGVIIATTKSGKAKDGSILFNFSSGISTPTRTLKDVGYTNTKQWFSTMDEAYQNTYNRNFKMSDYYQYASNAFTVLSRPQAEAINTDWYDQVFQKGTFNDFNLSSSQSFEKGSFYISGNYRKDKGVQKNNNLEKFSFRSNVDFNPNKNLTVSAKVTLMYGNNEQRNSGINSLITYTLPWFPVYDPNNPNQYFNPYTGNNPKASNDASNFTKNVKQYRGLGMFALNYRLPFINGLSLRTEVAADLIQSNLINWQSRNIFLLTSDKSTKTSSGNTESVLWVNINYNAYATFEKEVGIHSFSAVGGLEATRIKQRLLSLSGNNLSGSYPEVNQPLNVKSVKQGLDGERYLLGYFGRINYKLNNKYLFGLSARRDGSSAFTNENRWQTFVAGSAGWILSDEKFLSSLWGNSIFLKLRGSYGETGNQNLKDNLSTQLYNNISPYSPGTNGTVPTNIPNSNLKWEKTKSSEIGLDYGFLNNRFNGSIAYYHRFVTRMLLPEPLPVSAGIGSNNSDFGQGSYDLSSNSIYVNIGSMVNSGFEFELYSINYDRGGFKWRTDFNISINKNIIKSLTKEADQNGKGINPSDPNVPTVSRVGQKRNEWILADYAGVDPETGVPMIYALDINKYNTTGATERLHKIEGGDSLIYATRTNIKANRFYQTGKSPDPKYYGGITNTFTWKGFDFSFMFAFSGGNYILDYDRQIAAVPSETRILLSDLQQNSWKFPGDHSKYPQLTARGQYTVNGNIISDFGDADSYHNRELYKGDYIRLRNVRLGYTFSKTFLQKIKMQGASIYVTGSNLWTKTAYPGFDPEGAGFLYYSTAIPQLKTFTIGIDIKL